MNYCNCPNCQTVNCPNAPAEADSGAAQCYAYCVASVGLTIGYFIYQILARRYNWGQAADHAYFSVTGIWTTYLINRLTKLCHSPENTI